MLLFLNPKSNSIIHLQDFCSVINSQNAMTMSGCRMSHHLRGCNPRQLGICSFYFYQSPRPPPPPLLRKFPRSPCSARLPRFKLSCTGASCSSSSSVTNNNDDLAGFSLIDSDACARDSSHHPLLSDCLIPAENDRASPSEGLSSLAGGIVALGKFDALHIGHRELAIQASKIGVPFLLSFIGMGEILGWEPRAPIVAKCDRKRVLASWAPLCEKLIPREFHIEFSKVRNLSPEQFVEKLSVELGVGGVVAGENYRFGYRASGDSSDLVRLCKEYGMKAYIVNPVMDKKQRESKDIDSDEQGQVSSTRVRHALANGDMEYVSELLGRNHRVILMVKKNKQEEFLEDRKRLSGPRSCLLNLPPKEGFYRNCSLAIDEENLVACKVTIDSMNIHLELDELAPCISVAAQNLGIEFGGDSQV